MFAKMYVMTYLLLLHIFQTITVVSMQDEGSFDSSSLKAFQNKSQLGYFFMYAMFLNVGEKMKFKTISVF